MKTLHILVWLMILSLLIQLIAPVTPVMAAGGNFSRPSVSLGPSVPDGSNLPDGDNLPDQDDPVSPEVRVEQFGTVLPDKVFTIFFSSAVDVLTVGGATIKVYSSFGQEIPVNLVTAVSGLSVSVTPQADYQAGDYILKTLPGLRDALSNRALSYLVEVHFSVAGSTLPDRIDLTPAFITLAPGQTTRFSASLAGGSTSKPLIWSAFGDTGHAGTVFADGVYQAPQEPGSYRVQVKSEEFPSLSAQATVLVQAARPGNIDLALASSNLDFPAEASPGRLVTLKADILNQSADGQRPGGTVVRFIVDNRIVDEVPIYLDADDDTAQARIWYYLPETSAYTSLAQGEKLPISVQAVIDPYNRLTETNESNNQATGTIQIQFAYDQPLKNTDPVMTIDATSLSVWSVDQEAPKDRVSAAQPGQKLHLKAHIQTTGEDTTEDINIRFLINGLVVFDDNRRVTTTGGYFDATCNYQVPFSQTEDLDFQVLLSNGSSARIRIPVQRYDVGIMPGDIYWRGNDDYARAGKTLYMKAQVKNISLINFPHEDARIAWRALLNGQFYAEGDYRLYQKELLVELPAYTVPSNLTGPLVLTLVTDVYDQLDEVNEANNVATIRIPLASDGLLGYNLSVEPVDLLHQPDPVVPGATLTLSVDIHKQGVTPLNRDVEVLFKVNSQMVDIVTYPRGYFHPDQATEVSTIWVDTIGLQPGQATLEVVVDPNDFIPELHENDNSVTQTIEVAKPDLDVSGQSIRWSPSQPATGSAVHLKAIIGNVGDGPAIDSKIRFFADGVQIGREDVTIERINAASAAYAELTWSIPSVPILEIPYNTLIGYTGKQEVPSMVTKAITLQVRADPDDQILEKDEANNQSDSQVIEAVIPTDRKFVFIQLFDSISCVSAAKVTLTAENGESDYATSGNNGWCSFTGVPVGKYSVLVEKQGYDIFRMGGEVLRTSPPQYRTFTLLRNQEFVGMSGLDSDNDMVSDADETGIYSTNKSNPDTDGDGVIDGRDLAPLTNPVDPIETITQEVGMIRFEQPVCLHGFDGQVEIYDEIDHLFSEDEYSYDKTFYERGTYTSDMGSADELVESVNQTFASSNFSVYNLKNIDPADVKPWLAANYPEKYADRKFEAMYVSYSGDNQYRIDYDFIIDYRLASLKNTSEILYPTAEQYFGYLLMPVMIDGGYKHTFKFQIKKPGVADKVYYNDDTNYHQLGFQYSFYRTNRFDDDSNLPVVNGVALADCDGSDLFAFSITLPADQAIQNNYYLKITPSWVDNHFGQVTLAPLEESWGQGTGSPGTSSGCTWNLTGLVREITYLANSSGESQVVRESMVSLTDLASPWSNVSTIKGLASLPAAKTWHPANGVNVLIYNPQDAEGDIYQTVEMDQQIITYVETTMSGAKKTLELIETISVFKNGYKTLDEIPSTSIFKHPGYEALTDGLDAIGGIVSIYTDGTKAWMAYEENDKILCAFYTLKVATDVASEANSMIKISTNIAAIAGKTSVFTKFPAEQVGIGIAIVISLIDMSISFYKFKTATCPIQETAYAEEFTATSIDLALFAVGILFPPLGLFELVWFGVHELYGLVLGKNLAYRMTDTFAEAIVTVALIESDSDVNSEIAKEGYQHALDRLSWWFAILIEDQSYYPFVPVIVDPTD